MIKNRIKECRAPNAKLIDEPAGYIVIHRTSLALKEPSNPNPIADKDLDIVKLAYAFCRGPMASYTGGLLPYHLLVRRDGVIEQGLPFDVRGAHAKGYNHRSIAIAYVGEHDFLFCQMRAIIRACKALVLHTKGARIAGHTALAGASSDVHKVCPHASFSVPSLERTIREELPPDWRTITRQRIELTLKAEGYQLSGLEELTK